MPHSQKTEEEEIKEHQIEVGIPNIESKAGKKPRKKRRTRPGVGALREMRKQQQKVETVIPKAAFRRLVRDLIGDATQGTGLRVEQEAFLALQTISEEMLIELFRKSNDIAVSYKRKGPVRNDMRLVLKHDPRIERATVNYETHMIHVPSKRKARKIKT